MYNNMFRTFIRCSHIQNKLKLHQDNINKLSEVVQNNRFLPNLQKNLHNFKISDNDYDFINKHKQTFLNSIKVAFATNIIHKNSRIFSSISEGFYTIGPCGEELLAVIGFLLRPKDPTSLHYRHSAIQTAKQYDESNLNDLILNRARAYVCSSLDPVTGGVHCSIGGDPNYDFINTSTLSSHSPQAVGRALSFKLMDKLNLQGPFPNDSISFCSLGEGSVNNAEFLTALNMAEYSYHRIKHCPVFFAISDNGLSISLKGYGWIDKFMKKRFGMETFTADGKNIIDIYKTTKNAIDLCRTGKPVAVLYQNLPRRFGHASTDLQDKYLTKDEILKQENENPIIDACSRLITSNIITYDDITSIYLDIGIIVNKAFEIAANEPKISSRDSLLKRVKPEIISKPIFRTAMKNAVTYGQTMRKNMTLGFEEIMTDNPNIVYIGEDVQSGGYYRITDNLNEKFKYRVRSFPPDETSLIATGIGFAQAGLLPIVEIPYAAYLNCGFNQFTEACIFHWLSNGKQKNGMIIRLQGFDEGIFGGNFHTQNTLIMPPGLEVVCYSNGEDYVKGLRFCVEQIKKGSVIMLVDSTKLLNMKHIHDKDDGWLRKYPNNNEILHFDEIIQYGNGKDLTIVSFGNGVVKSLQTQKILKDKHGINCTVIDTPYISNIPKDFINFLDNEVPVLFADVCKSKNGVYDKWVVELNKKGILPKRWNFVGALDTYNPLGSTLTFLSVEDIVEGALKFFK